MKSEGEAAGDWRGRSIISNGNALEKELTSFVDVPIKLQMP